MQFELKYIEIIWMDYVINFKFVAGLKIPFWDCFFVLYLYNSTADATGVLRGAFQNNITPMTTYQPST